MNPLILAFDTSGPFCAAALLRGGDVLDARVEEMKRGQAERLMSLLEEILATAGVTWRDLDAIGVGIGPGNFTGIRISVSAARGLALGLGIPAVGVTGFESLGLSAPDGTLPAIPAPRDHVYIRRSAEAPELVPANDAKEIAPLYLPEDEAKTVIAIARIAAERYRITVTPPAPFYIRPADAAPSRDVPPVLLDE
ncbi:tRNA (adenosine(37)-N6)-threonylcarbamoyltransferase complex dimerization subunit type 1 TsaB [Tropicibacter sp. R16_0]|uniref:tRNA (adenosine(37)-N6)-threonylcarbamoyltransferase complex dimerization subunit type 1 TsaB n=1 Tax=Tropicibacter sp. R16_0 TaxID=2821102 RepID=UPI001ADCDFC2|nr:tRNA (adenosine(37)-N6)-threonylcarbamoyltransferase complex dimerization subunit type 1 TsaB [Tropicibacter sp. R16_0]MBO9450909.1 tRNA (adenosine(37)-N6)-threonylcarbamoyltransferase complex dimerization subunit type 1 TsaB [Tropicibacter sp. R16_0]